MTAPAYKSKPSNRQLEPLTIGQLAWVLKHLPNKACGPDAVTAQLLRTAPPLALQPLLKLFHEMEAQAMLPTQQQMHMVVMLPKNSSKERPIALTSVLYRVWRRLRKPLLDQWQKQLPATMDHDRSRPGASLTSCPRKASPARSTPSQWTTWRHMPRGYVHLLPSQSHSG